MNSTLKGDKLEDAFYRYLIDQQNRGELLFDIYPPENCKIFRKKKYYCKQREDDVEFDIVLEVYRKGRHSPHLHVIFECKNYNGNIPETYVNDFSSKIGRIFPNAVKGVLVISSRLQSGAEKVALNNKMGIVKYDETGLDIIADRTGRIFVENRFIEAQIFSSAPPTKSLKFSAYHDGRFFGNLGRFLCSLDPNISTESKKDHDLVSARYIPNEHIKKSAAEVLKRINYKSGPVDLEKVCSCLSIDLQFTNQKIQDENGIVTLGSANFRRRLILINAHENKNRERFTIGHEIGHFCLNHEMYLSSETIVEKDLLINSEKEVTFNYERLEFQANIFSANLILPDEVFKNVTGYYRHILDIKDRGHGYIFVDDQPCNFMVYEELLSILSTHFGASKTAIEIKFKNLGMLTDQRKRRDAPPIPGLIKNLIALRKTCETRTSAKMLHFCNPDNS
ncbi:ImmA/IrrE family metallo-endopeptidase [Ochrobactrum teleogrylli]|uniref:ImmA/IrrE family metallo-endopeptidase n=1 Tax=Ochrobactrum teleogrylli TaxID=2479765 RepID=A0ABD5JXA2_9HYPH